MRQELQQQIAGWLFDRLPGYARQHVDPLTGDIGWEKLISSQMLFRYSTGEKWAIALVGHLTDRSGVVRVCEGGLIPNMLHRQPKSAQVEWIALLAAVMGELS